MLGTLEDILAGPPVKKLLFMTSPSIVNGRLKPDWAVSEVMAGLYCQALVFLPMRWHGKKCWDWPACDQRQVTSKGPA